MERERKRRRISVFPPPGHHAMQEEEEEVDGGGSDGVATADDSEMSFNEFLEAVVSISVYHIPDPYISLAAKTDYFITKVLLPRARMTAAKRTGPPTWMAFGMLKSK